ncbi:MAG: cyclic pyranopterin monophosphate synthase MoaC [Nitriliruptoraceae bacterium]
MSDLPTPTGTAADGTGSEPSERPSAEAALTHVDAAGRARMVDVAAKPVTDRVAVATAVVRLAPHTAALLLDGALPKGDALPVVRLAGIQAAKRTHELIPLCHQVALTSVDVEVVVAPDSGEVTITATARATDRTGVEMEAMTAVAVAALTLYDLVKAVQRDVVISEVRLREKRGGRSGDVVLP